MMLRALSRRMPVLLLRPRCSHPISYAVWPHLSPDFNSPRPCASMEHKGLLQRHALPSNPNLENWAKSKAWRASFTRGNCLFSWNFKLGPLFSSLFFFKPWIWSNLEYQLFAKQLQVLLSSSLYSSNRFVFLQFHEREITRIAMREKRWWGKWIQLH